MAEAKDENRRRNSFHGKYIKSVVWGGLDGIVTTFVVVAGATGASLSSGVLIILGLGSLLGDAVSMGVGDYAGSHAEKEYHEAERQHQAWLFDNNPEQERLNIIQMYKTKHISDADARTVVNILTKKKKTAVELMMLAEHGALEVHESPAIQGFYTFLSFITFGFVPLLTYLLAPFFPQLESTKFIFGLGRFVVETDYRFIIATGMTVITLFCLGACKGYVTKCHWFRSGFEMLMIGSFAATIAYVIGYALSGIA